MDIFSMLQSMRRHSLKIIAILILSFLAGRYYLSTLRPFYTATTEVLIEERRSPVDLGEMLGGRQRTNKALQTELMVIRSGVVLREVVETLDLLKDAEFNPTVAPPPPAAWKQFLMDQGVWPIESFSLWPPRLVIGEPPQPVAFRADEGIMRGAIGALQAKTRAGVTPGTTILWVSVQAWEPEKAALIANAVAEAYRNARAQARVDAQRLASEFISERVVELQEEVETAEAAVQAFRSERGIIDENNVEVVRLEEVENRLEAMQTLRRSLENRLQGLTDALNSSGGLREAARVLNDRRINALLAAGYDERLRQEIDQVSARLKTELETARRREAALQSSRDALAATLEQEAQDLVRLRQLVREATASRVLLETFLTRQRETAAQQNFPVADTRVLTVAEPRYGPSSPNRRRIYMFFLAFGGALSFGLVFLLERSRNRFITIEELEAWSGHAVLGSIPRHVSVRQRSSVLDHVRKTPGGSLAEAVRNLRTSILLANVDTPPKVITMTSSVPEEGKSLTAVLLATVTAQMGKRAIIIDVDLRRRTLHNTMKMNDKPGLIAALNGSCDVEKAIKEDPTSGLHVMTVERTRASAPDLLSSHAFDELLGILRRSYDLIILDAPPVLPVTDARILAKKSDALVYAVKWNDTPRDVVQHGLASLTTIGVHISGLVLTQVDRKKQKRYGYGYYGHRGYGAEKYYRKSERYYTD